MSPALRQYLREQLDAHRRDYLTKFSPCRRCGLEKERGTRCAVCALKPPRPRLSEEEVRRRQRLRQRAYAQSPAGRVTKARELAKRRQARAERRKPADRAA